MKNLKKLVLIFAIAIFNQAIFAQNVTWDFGASGTLSATETIGGILDDNASYGSGIGGIQFVNANSSSGGKAIQAFGWSLTSAIETNDYFEFCVTNDSDEGINIDQFDFWTRRGGTGNGPQYHQLDYAIDGGSATTLITDGWNSSSSSGSSHSQPTNIAVAVGSQICFTLYGYGAQKANGTLLVDDASITISGIVLPVKFSSFEAQVIDNKTLLNWSTASEINNDYFAIEHSSNGKQYTTIGQVLAAGDGSRNQDYDFTHDTPINGNNYYRLKQVDLDGSFAYSDVAIASNISIEKTYSLQPTLIQDKLTVDYNGETASIILTNINGQIIFNQTIENSTSIDLSQLSKGSYIAILNIDGKRYTERVIKQ